MNITNQSEDSEVAATKYDPTIGIKPVKYTSLRRQITNTKGHPLAVRYSEDPNKTGIFFEYDSQVRRRQEEGQDSSLPCTAFRGDSSPPGAIITKGRLLLVRYAENQCRTGIFSRHNAKSEKRPPERVPRPLPPPSPLAASPLAPQKCQQNESEAEEQNKISKTRFTVNTFCRRFCCARK